MDTRTATPIDVAGKIEEIKRFMPTVYRAIQDKAVEMGQQAYAQVRRGLRGEANCFYAFEAGRVVGTPFALGPIPAETAALMVQFGCSFVCIFGAVDASAHPPIGTPGAMGHTGNSAPAVAPVAGTGNSPVISPVMGE